LLYSRFEKVKKARVCKGYRTRLLNSKTSKKQCFSYKTQ